MLKWLRRIVGIIFVGGGVLFFASIWDQPIILTGAAGIVAIALIISGAFLVFK